MCFGELAAMAGTWLTRHEMLRGQHHPAPETEHFSWTGVCDLGLECAKGGDNGFKTISLAHQEDPRVHVTLMMDEETAEQQFHGRM